MSVQRVDNDQKLAVRALLTPKSSPVLSKILSFLRPIAFQLIPLTVFFLFIPLILFLSISAGWVVWRNVAVGWETTLYLQYGDNMSPYAEVALPNLVPHQRYDISLHLVVPASETNFALGNFMTALRLSTPSNHTLTYVRRPTIALPPDTGRIPLLSSRPSLVNMKVPLLTSYVPGTTQVVANVTLGRSDGWRSLGNGQGREISVLSASLKGVVRHHGVRGIVTRFPLLSAFISAIVFFIISSLIIAACLLPTMRRRYDSANLVGTSDARHPPPSGKDDDDGASSDDGKRRKKRRRSKRRKSRSASQSTEFKAEGSSTMIPPIDSKPTSIRKRLSKSELVDSDM